MLRALLEIRAPTPAASTQLGRWCTPLYSETCDQARKADLANEDNSFGGPRRPDPLPKPDYSMCPVARTVANTFGM